MPSSYQVVLWKQERFQVQTSFLEVDASAGATACLQRLSSLQLPQEERGMPDLFT
jgi:hypothetical protein